MNPTKPNKEDAVSELIIDAYGCQSDLSNAKELEETARKAVLSVGATIAETACHRFQPHGLTLCLILKESHLIISTWPEHKLAIVNIFLCNDQMDTKKCWAVLEKVLKPESTVFHSVKHAISSGKKSKAA